MLCFLVAVLQLISQGATLRVSHPWVNQYMQVVGHPDLHGWDGTNPPMIGDIVSAVIQEFRKLGGNGNSSQGHDQEAVSWRGQRAQPTGLSAAQSTTGSFGTGNPPYRATASGVGEVSAGGQARPNPSDTSTSRGRETRPKKKKPKHHTPIPAIPTKFDELQDLPTQRLTRLLDDNIARQALLLEMTSVVEMKGLRTDVLNGNVETARSTVSKQETARVLREEAERMRLELKDLQTSYEGLSLFYPIVRPSIPAVWPDSLFLSFGNSCGFYLFYVRGTPPDSTIITAAIAAPLYDTWYVTASTTRHILSRYSRSRL